MFVLDEQANHSAVFVLKQSYIVTALSNDFWTTYAAQLKNASIVHTSIRIFPCQIFEVR